MEASAREKGSFLRSRAVVCATDLLRLVLAYCLGGMGLRSASAWAASARLADLSNVALLKHLRNCGAWMEHLAGTLLGTGVQPEAGGRRIRLLDGTTVPKAGKEAKKNSGLWRLHCAFDLPKERFSFIELTDEKGGERLDRTSFAKGDITIADRGYMHPEPLAHICEQVPMSCAHPLDKGHAGWRVGRQRDKVSLSGTIKIEIAVPARAIKGQLRHENRSMVLN